MAELVPARPSVVMSEENVVLEDKGKGFRERVILNGGGILTTSGPLRGSKGSFG